MWKVRFAARSVDGVGGKTLSFLFRGKNEAGTANDRPVSDRADFEIVADGAWHWYEATVTIADDAYAFGKSIVPYFGWLTDNTVAGTLRVNGVTVYKVGNQWDNTADFLGFDPSTSALAPVEEVDSRNSPIAYQKTVKLSHLGTSYLLTKNAPLASFADPTATDEWTLSFWAKTDGMNAASLCKAANGAPVCISIDTDGAWRFFVVSISAADLSKISLYFQVQNRTSLYLNGINLVPGDVALANDSRQNSAALKNVTIDTGAVKFNTAIEYDTDENRTAYSRVKHYINNGKAYSYEYDEVGNIAKITNPDGTAVTYEYDALNQLIAETYHNLPCQREGDRQAAVEGFCCEATVVTYTYDSRGNILTKTTTDANGVETTVTYSYTDTVWADRLTDFNGTAITYDAIGNPLNWQNGVTLTWQHGRQLATYKRGYYNVSYTYNQDGIRTAKTVNGFVYTYTVVDGTLRRFTAGDNTLEFINGTSVIFNGTEYWYVFNAQNDVIGIIDASGNYVVEYTYDAWGKILSQTGSMASTLGYFNPFRYRGYIYDEESGLYYCQSRYYDPVVGRWLNADGYLTTDTTELGSNMFAYCENNPVNCIDSTGECPRYYTPITCPICNQSRLANNLGYSDYDNNPNCFTTDNGMQKYYLVDTIYFARYSFTKEEAEALEKKIKKQNINKTIMENLYAKLPISAVVYTFKLYSTVIKCAANGLKYLGNALGLLNRKKVEIGYEEVYTTSVCLYANVYDHNKRIVVTTTYSMNEYSYLHDAGTIYEADIFYNFYMNSYINTVSSYADVRW